MSTIQKLNQLIKANPYLWISLVFLLIYSSLSLVNHYYFRSFAHDLGIRNNALFDYMQFRWNETGLMFPDKKFSNILGDHFCLLPIIVSPFQFVFGSSTLLLFQIASIIWGGIGIYRLTNFWFSSTQIAAWAQVHFYLFWGIFSALSFDYHDNVIAAMMLPWLFYHFSKKNYPLAFLYLVIIWISKENMALWSIFISLGLMLHFWKRTEQRKIAAYFSLLSLLVFILIIKILMPWAGDGQAYQHNNYAIFEGGITHLIRDSIANPSKYFALLFEPPAQSSYAYAIGIKSELHFFLFLSGGIFLFFKPALLVMALPILGQKLLNNDPVKWGVLYHYSIEFAPLLTMASFLALKDFRTKKLFKPIFIVLIVSAFFACFHLLDRPTRSLYYHSSHIRFYYNKHWQREFDVKQVRSDLKIIPKDAVVSAHNVLVSRLAFRNTVYLFPYFDDKTNYIVLLRKEIDTYPLNKENYSKKIDELRNSMLWNLHYESDDLLIFKKEGT